MFTITKEFSFEAAHHLPEMPDGHKCKNHHGHSYIVIVELASPILDNFGFVEDYGALADIKEYIDTNLDHKDLTDVFGKTGNTTTAERIAYDLFHWWNRFHPLLQAVTVKETAKTSATYRWTEPTSE